MAEIKNVDLKKGIKNLNSDELRKLDKKQLQQLYKRAKELYADNCGPLSRVERQNLYIIQEGLFGNVDPKTQASLENIGKTLVKKPDKRKKAIDYNMPCAGSVLVKNWKGKQLEVKILTDGFEHKNQYYKSLSKLAKEIAGYAVSGPIFFGLRKPKARVPVI